MTSERRIPPIGQSTFVLGVISAAWLALRIYLFRESVLPLTFVLPLLLCVWTRRRWQLWTMAVAFAAARLAQSEAQRRKI